MTPKGRQLGVTYIHTHISPFSSQPVTYKHFNQKTPNAKVSQGTLLQLSCLHAWHWHNWQLPLQDWGYKNNFWSSCWKQEGRRAERRLITRGGVPGDAMGLPAPSHNSSHLSSSWETQVFCWLISEWCMRQNTCRTYRTSRTSLMNNTQHLISLEAWCLWGWRRLKHQDQHTLLVFSSTCSQNSHHECFTDTNELSPLSTPIISDYDLLFILELDKHS